ncbi:MAG: hypothetical protein AAGA48_30715 [Myxococcota bacterium]
MTFKDHLRGALIALALIAHGIYALPLPYKVTEVSLKEDWRQRDIRLWRGWLKNAGIDVTHEQIEANLMWATNLTGSLHKTLKAPFAPLFRITQSNQAWALFAAASTKPERLVIEVREHGQREWRPILRRLDPCCTWKEPIIRYRRIRGIWDGQKRRARRPYLNLTQWLADQVLVEMPEVDEVRIYLEQGRTVYPWEPPDETRIERHVRKHRRPRKAK